MICFIKSKICVRYGIYTYYGNNMVLILLSYSIHTYIALLQHYGSTQFIVFIILSDRIREYSTRYTTLCILCTTVAR